MSHTWGASMSIWALSRQKLLVYQEDSLSKLQQGHQRCLKTTDKMPL